MQHLDDGLLHALVDGEVPSAELGPIQAHLDGCADCRVRLDEARNMAGESNALIELIEVPAARDGSPAAGPQPRRRAATWLRPLALAASLALAVGLGYAGGAWQRGVLERQMSSGVSAFRVDTVFVAQDRASAPAEEVSPQATVSAAPDPELAAGRQLAKTKEEREQADERQAAAPAPAELDRAPPPAPTVQASRDSALAQRLRSSEFRLNEVVVAATGERRQTQAAGNQARDLKDSVSARDAAQLKRQDNEVKRALNEGAPKSAAAAPPAARQEELVATTIRATPITFYEATTLLGGQLRLIDGMVPTRLEQVGTAVRVVYSLGQGELFLEQRRDADSLAVVLIGPTLSPDSLGKLRQKIR